MFGPVARARVEGVAIQDQMADALEKRAQLRESPDPAGGVAEMDVGKDARDHRDGMKIAEWRMSNEGGGVT